MWKATELILHQNAQNIFSHMKMALPFWSNYIWKNPEGGPKAKLMGPLARLIKFVQELSNCLSFVAKLGGFDTTLLRFAVEVQVFHCVQIPLHFHCIFYRQTMQILNVKTAKKYLQWVVCKKCSETAVGFVTQWKPVVFAVKILAVLPKV